MTHRVAVIDRGFISPYWSELFRLLNSGTGFEYVVYHGDPPTGTGLRAASGPYDFPNVWVKNREIRILRWTGIYQPVVKAVLAGGFDAIIISHELKFLSNVLLAVLCKLRGTPIILWGYGYHARRGLGYRVKASGLMTRLSSGLKDRAAKWAAGYLAYTPRGAARMKSIGFPEDRIWIVRQAVNMEQQVELHGRYADSDPVALRESLGLRPDSAVLLYLGRLVEAKQVDGLLKLVSRLNADPEIRQPVEARIVGGGPEAERLKAQAAATPGAELVGEIYDQDLIARYMRVASALVLPGAGGITVTHAFAHGLPVLTRESELHSPEVEYVVSGENGLVAEGGFDKFVETVKAFVTTPELRQRLAAGALASRATLSLAFMVQQFHDAVAGVVDGRRPAATLSSASRSDRRSGRTTPRYDG